MAGAIFAALLVFLGFGALAELARRGVPLAPVMVPLVRNPPPPGAQPSGPAPTTQPTQAPQLPAAEPTEPPPVPQWSKSSLVLSGQPDPYNQAYADAVGRAELARRDLWAGDFGAAAQAGVAIGTAAIGAISSSGVGAIAVGIAVAVYELLARLTGPSSGGFEKLAPLQRQRAVLYQLLADFETGRQKTVWTSQHLWQPMGPDPAFQNLVPLPAGDPHYADRVRDTLIRLRYAFEFHRVVSTEDDASLPGAAILAAEKAGMWPPPLLPLPLTEPELWGPQGNPTNLQWRYFYFAATLAKFDQAILKQEHAKLTAACMADAQRFADRLAGACGCAPDVYQFALQNGSNPAPGIPGGPKAT